jgi:hypothetical protein
MADAVPVSGPGDAADEASSYAERVNAALSEATVNALRERLASGGVPVRTVRRRVADETRQPEAQMPVRVETLARLLCDTDSTLTDGPGWDRISQTPGLGRDEYRNAARYLLRHVTVTQTLDGPAPLLCGDQIPDMTCTLPDGTHDDWKHRDEEGHWWSQMRVPPHSNRDRIAVEDPTP